MPLCLNCPFLTDNALFFKSDQLPMQNSFCILRMIFVSVVTAVFVSAIKLKVCFKKPEVCLLAKWESRALFCNFLRHFLYFEEFLLFNSWNSEVKKKRKTLFKKNAYSNSWIFLAQTYMTCIRHCYEKAESLKKYNNL